jgi:hypothetical protein
VCAVFVLLEKVASAIYSIIEGYYLSIIQAVISIAVQASTVFILSKLYSKFDQNQENVSPTAPILATAIATPVVDYEKGGR